MVRRSKPAVSKQSTVDNSVAGVLLRKVCESLDQDASNGVFAIGGTINRDKSDDPLTLRWDTKGLKQGCKVSLPLNDDEDSQLAFQQLLHDCQPASFGRGMEVVMDENYRKASKMDPTDFCTNFNLAGSQVMYTLTQALVQSALLKAEGGALVFRHGGKEAILDWSCKSADSVQWAAFFSDCEHEILEVTQGHWLTLTFNLFWASGGPSLMATRPGALKPQSLHFYAALQQLYQCPEFLSKGGRIGFSCTHGYPHTSHAGVADLDATLKGIDMAVYQALEQLNGSVTVLAVLDVHKWEEWLEMTRMPVESPRNRLEQAAYLSSKLGPTIVTDDMEDDCQLDPETLMFGGRRDQTQAFGRTGVVWLNSAPRTFGGLAAVFLTYGNQPGIDTYYSAAVIIATVPSFEERKTRWAGDDAKGTGMDRQSDAGA